MNIQALPLLIRWWKGPPVIVLVPSSEAVCIRRGEGPIGLITKVPIGAMRVIPLTEERKQFLLREDMDPDLIKNGRVFDVSEALATEFEKELEAAEALAAKCGLSKEDINKIFRAKKKLTEFQPKNRLERLAKRGLESMLFGIAQKKEAGRPKRITAEDRQQMRQRADELRIPGCTRSEIVSQLAEEYGLGLSYVRRILEDRYKTKETV